MADSKMPETQVWRDTSSDLLPRTLIDRAARYYSMSVAVRTPERDWSYAEILDRVNRLSNGLLQRGVGRNCRVAVLRWNEMEQIEISLALLKIGAAMVNINPRSTISEVEWQISDSDASFLIASEAFRETIEALPSDLIGPNMMLIFGSSSARDRNSYEQLLSTSRSTDPLIEVTASDPAYIRFTSGTTGRPKGVIHDQTTILAVTRNLLLDYVSDMSRNDIFLPLQGLYHGAGWFVLACWIRGVPIVVVPGFDAEQATEYIERFQPTIIKSVPTVLTRLFDHLDREPNVRGKSVRTIVYGASPMPAAVLSKGLELFGPIFVQLYGQAESPMTITVLRKEEHDLSRLSATGRPITLAKVRLVDEAGDDVQVGEVGEVIVAGDHNMRGYWNRPPEVTSDVLKDGWVHTRDMGVFDAEGFLHLVSRKSEMIITGGLNVYPNEVEQVLYDHPDVLEAAVVGLPDREWGEVLVAAIVVRNGAQLSEEMLSTYSHDQLASFKRPKKYTFVDELPKNASGKIVRREVLELIKKQEVEVGNT